MKQIFLKISALLLVLVFFCSCGNTKVLKTKEITNKLTQTAVVTESDIKANENYVNFFKEFSSGFTIPGLLEGIIPQGVCYIEKLSLYAVSGYFKDAEFPSMIMLVDAKTNKFSKAFSLQDVDGNDYYGHAGGLAASDDYIYLTSEETCNVFSVDGLKSLKNGETLKFESNFKLNTGGAFACFNDGILWTGDFIESSDSARKNARKITTLSSGETFYAYCEGYILNEGLPDVKKINSQTNGYIPDYMLAIPEQVQGMTFTNSGKIVFSASYGRRSDSKIYVYDDVMLSERVGTYKIDETQIDLIACSNDLLKQTVTAPPMAEGITRAEKGILLIFESGASKYRNHRGKYPTDTAFNANIE
ncbi:MAG: hypothetical protein ACI4VW_01205 [Acutalibacteraceae bacterium]